MFAYKPNDLFPLNANIAPFAKIAPFTKIQNVPFSSITPFAEAL